MSKTDSIPRHDYSGFAFPKAQRKKSVERAAAPEKSIQAGLDARLRFAGIKYLRLSETLLRTIFANPMIPVHIKKIVSDELAGWPDNICYIPISDKYCLCAMIECKTTIGKLNGAQKRRSAGLPYVVVRSDNEAAAALAGFEKMAGLVADGVRAYEEKRPVA